MITTGGHKVLNISRQRLLIVGNRVCYIVCCGENVSGKPLYVLQLLLLNMLQNDCVPVCMLFTNVLRLFVELA